MLPRIRNSILLLLLLLLYATQNTLSRISLVLRRKDFKLWDRYGSTCNREIMRDLGKNPLLIRDTHTHTHTHTHITRERERERSLLTIK
jgi:hypothetical protein